MYAFRGKSNEELISMGIAPVSRNHWIQTTGGKVSTPTGNESGSQATAKTSKRQLKKERQKKRAKAFCFNFARGICDKGGACKFSHEVEAYIANRQPDLPGQCPYSNYSICPFGVLCRWANSHVIKDDLTQKAFALHDPSKQAHPQPPIGNKDGMLSPLDGEIPGHSQIALPILPQLPAPQNTLSKDLQQKLWKKQFDFRSADRLVKELQSGKGGSFSKASLQSNEAERDLQPSSKKQKIEVGGNALQTATDTISPEVVRPNEKEHLQNSDREMNGNANTAQAVLKASEDNGQKAEPAGHQRAREEINPLAGLEAGLSKSSSNEEPAQKSTKDVGKARNGLSELEDNAMALLYDAREANMETETTFINTPLHANEKRKIDFKGKLYLAPLTTVGNLPFRRVCKGLGADITCGEMAVATNLLQGQASEWALLKRDSSEDCFGVQICGGYPDHMTRCAALLEDNIDVDFVDINMGCPIDLICCKGAGSALLTKPNRMEQVVRGVSSMLSCPLSIKVRRGYNDGQDVAHDILPCVKEWGASAATLHGRSRQQRYSREADWDYIAKCVQAAKPLPLIGNGDIFAYTDYEDHIKNIPGLATTMIARGALIKPWIFTEIKERRHWDISASERLDILKKFCSTGLLHWGSDEKGVETTRRFLLEWLSYLCRYIPVGLLEVLPQKVGWRPPLFKGRSDLETLLSSFDPQDWIKISEMLLGPVPGGFSFQAKHKSNAYASSEKTMSLEGDQENG